MRNIEGILEETGLTPNETKVFLSSVKLGAASVSQVAKGANIARTYTYELIEALKTKGLLAEIEERGKIKIEALDYSGLLSYISRRQKDLQRLEKDLINSAGAFHALRSTNFPKTKVRFFEGVEGVKSILAEVRKDLEKINRPYNFYVVFSADRMEAMLPGWIEHNQHIYFEEYMRKYAIISETPLLKNFSKIVAQQQQKNFHYKIWPKEKEFPTDALCWLNKITFIDTQGHPSGIIIENQALVETFKMWFEQMWDGLKAYRTA
jgi:hypothetical protein